MQGLPQASSLTELLTGSFISAVNAIPYVVWIARADGHIEYLNTTWREITGYTHNNPAQESWLDCLHADQRHTFMPSWQDAVHSGEPWTMEFKLWSSADKDYRWQKAHAKAFPDSGGWIGSCHDIHDQKLAEQLLKTSETRLRSVIEESPVGVVLLDRTGQPVYYNRKCAELRGLEVNQGVAGGSSPRGSGSSRKLMGKGRRKGNSVERNLPLPSSRRRGGLGQWQGGSHPRRHRPSGVCTND